MFHMPAIKKHVVYYIIILQLFSFSLFAQDDTIESISGTFTFANDEIDKEKLYLDFKSSFIDALRHKNIENYDKALESLAKCETIYPENVPMLFEKAKNHFLLKQYVEAHYYCEKALSIEPENFWIMALSRDVYEKEYNYPIAIEIQKKLYIKKKSEADNLLKLYYRTKNKREGLALVNEIEQKNINVLNIEFYEKYFNPKTIVAPKKALQNETLNKDNLNDLKTVFALNKEYKVLQKILSKEAKEKQFDKLLSDSDIGLSLFPAQAKVYLYRGIALNGLEKFKEAIIILESGLDFVFDNSLLTTAFYNELIIAYTKTNNTVKANHYKQMVQKL